MSMHSFVPLLALSQAGAITEVREMRRDLSLNTADHWNPIDLLGLGLAVADLLSELLTKRAHGGGPCTL